jgi:ribosomal protein L40E
MNEHACEEDEMDLVVCLTCADELAPDAKRCPKCSRSSWLKAGGQLAAQLSSAPILLSILMMACITLFSSIFMFLFV